MSTKDSKSFCSRLRFMFLSGYNRILYFIVVLISIIFILSNILNITTSMFPETELVYNSKCENPIRNWDGKVLNFQIWPKTKIIYPRYFNLHNENEYYGNDSNHRIELKSGVGTTHHPVIIFGTHHKTGTFLAKKLFAKICAKMSWCCLFHVTRESIHSIKDGLQIEPVNALGHNQWIWYPEALGLRDYRFIHFYRDPFKKIISGYRYHNDGTEEWTKKSQSYHKICNTPLLNITSSSSSSSSNNVHSKDMINKTEVDRLNVWNYCTSIHLCETCCRIEHESVTKMNTNNANSVIKVDITFRSNFEYQFMCDNLGQNAIDNKGKVIEFPSLQEKLKLYPPEKGILTEAALDYYESLRMIKIMNHTIDDHRTLHIDIDDFTTNYDGITWKMLMHLKGIIPKDMLHSLHKDLRFYDLTTSPLYRWSMSNSIINHVNPTNINSNNLKGSNSVSNSLQDVTTKKSSSIMLMEILRNDPGVTRLYGPIYEDLKLIKKKITSNKSIK